MKIRRISIIISILILSNFAAFAQTTAFNFQGRLNDGGEWQLRFAIQAFRCSHGRQSSRLEA